MKPHIIYTRYEQPVVVQILKDDTKQWDFSGATYGDLARAETDSFAAGKELEIAGQAEHPLGYVFLLSDYALGFADVTGQPHKSWGVLANQVKQLRLVPLPPKRKLFGGIMPAGGSSKMSNDPLIEQPTSAPTRKVAAGLGAGALATLAVTLLAQFGIIIPDEVSAAAVAFVGAGVVLVQFVTAYLTKNRKSQS